MAFEKKWTEDVIKAFSTMWNWGKPVGYIASMFGIKEATVVRYAKKYGLEFPQPPMRSDREIKLAANQKLSVGSRSMHTLSVSPLRRSKMKDISAVPDELLKEWSLKLFALMNLTWDYVETVLDLCVQMRISETKKLCRTIRSLKSDYDNFRKRLYGSGDLENESEMAMQFEEICRGDFIILYHNLESDVRELNLTDRHRTLVVAVQQALTLTDAVKIYAHRCDKAMADMDVWVCDCCLVQTEFLKMAELLPQFAGDCYQPRLAIRQQTAVILTNRLERLGIEKYQYSKAQ